MGCLVLKSEAAISDTQLGIREGLAGKLPGLAKSMPLRRFSCSGTLTEKSVY